MRCPTTPNGSYVTYTLWDGDAYLGVMTVRDDAPTHLIMWMAQAVVTKRAEDARTS